MNKRGRLLKITAWLIACAILIVSTPRGLHSVSAANPPAPDANNGDPACKKVIQDIADDLKIETRKGEAVALRARQLKAKNKGMARAMKDLEKKSMKPAFEAGITILAVSKSGKYKKTGAQETTIVQGDIEMTFVSYDDGNPNTWEGIIYTRGPEVERVDYVQFDITNGLSTIHEQNYSYTRYSEPLDQTPVGYNGPAPGKSATAGSAKIMPISYMLGAKVSKALPQYDQMLHEWAVCVAAGCWSGLILCALAGPGWPQCAALGCFAVMVGCAIVLSLT